LADLAQPRHQLGTLLFVVEQDGDAQHPAR
jgi:hypothetical protein